eukprot:CAMPEP_0183526064 /NCGR_PEP_ID=MMETSP0371-20130417/21082_1 /TAXON_ID=268820 /ORGANISM="Peridinium aciculiferum, Strain PAER-2" /LENGTH=45 /DNA_ID= /DNA_START= /DNA_END= /DNA_ORIENTATION=
MTRKIRGRPWQSQRPQPKARLSRRPGSKSNTLHVATAEAAMADEE